MMTIYLSLVCCFDTSMLSADIISPPVHTGLSTSDYEEVIPVIYKDSTVVILISLSLSRLFMCSTATGKAFPLASHLLGRTNII